jgi:hypothetical protein
MKIYREMESNNSLQIGTASGTLLNTKGTAGQVLSSDGNGIASWTSASNSASSVVLHTAATCGAFLTIENLNFRYNNSTQTIEVQTISSDLNIQVYITKKTFGNILAEDGTIKNYKNSAYYNSSWRPIIQLWNPMSGTAEDLITINYYETMEANIHNMGTNTIPLMPNQSYRLFATKDGYGYVLIRVDFAK